MRKLKLRALKRKFGLICAAGTLFQTTQCSLTGEDVATMFIQNVASLIITDFVNNQFNVTSPQF